MGIANTHLSALPATSKDLFGLQACATPLFKGMDVTRRWLEDLGFSINKVNPEHWILTHSAPLPELHFYSDSELEMFARHRAHYYARRSFKEKRP
ncbi:hypothetical protein [Marinobacter subterrani]|uniref:hypothetical protein n=1 Tax=Marinobacter subterrani TaxID=1658765 RepID=UPI0023523AB1|nr:hypothetical protein [Marinobacter subterrani]